VVRGELSEDSFPDLLVIKSLFPLHRCLFFPRTWPHQCELLGPPPPVFLSRLQILGSFWAYALPTSFFLSLFSADPPSPPFLQKGCFPPRQPPGFFLALTPPHAGFAEYVSNHRPSYSEKSFFLLFCFMGGVPSGPFVFLPPRQLRTRPRFSLWCFWCPPRKDVSAGRALLQGRFHKLAFGSFFSRSVLYAPSSPLLPFADYQMADRRSAVFSSEFLNLFSCSSTTFNLFLLDAGIVNRPPFSLCIAPRH